VHVWNPGENWQSPSGRVCIVMSKKVKNIYICIYIYYIRIIKHNGDAYSHISHKYVVIIGMLLVVFLYRQGMDEVFFTRARAVFFVSFSKKKHAK
jgi:hypothetical protein